MLEGTVVDAATGLPLAGVAVSNGREVVPTDFQGRYRLPRFPHLEYIFVTVPSAYRTLEGEWCRPAAALPAAAPVDFALTPRPGPPPDGFTFLQVTDLPVATGPILTDTAAFYASGNALVSAAISRSPLPLGAGYPPTVRARGTRLRVEGRGEGCRTTRAVRVPRQPSP
jgi:hypothetical protein